MDLRVSSTLNLRSWEDSGCVTPWDSGSSLALTDHDVPAVLNTRAQFIPINGQGDVLKLELGTSLALFEAVMRCSSLAAIIGRLSDAYCNGKCEVLNRSRQNYVRGKYKDWERLLEKPNPIQSRADFRKQLFSYIKINGWCYVQPDYPAGYDNKSFDNRPTALWILPPWMMFVEPVTPTRETLITGNMRRLFFAWGGVRMELDETKLILFKDTTTDVNHYTGLPISRLVALNKPISNIIAVEDAENNLIRTRGGIGFISNDPGKDVIGPIAMTPDEKQDMQREFHRTNGLTGNRNLVTITTSAARWNAMAFNTKELMLIEIDESSAGKICDGFGYPYYLLSGGKGSTFSNVGEAEKSLYQNAVIPGAISLDEQMNEGLNTPDNNIEIRTAYSHIEALQQSQTEKANALKLTNQACLLEWEAGLLTLNEWRNRNGDDDIEGEQFDMRKPEYDKWIADNGFLPQMAISGAANAELTNLEQQNDGTTPANKGA